MAHGDEPDGGRALAELRPGLFDLWEQRLAEAGGDARLAAIEIPPHRH